jgi:hypothetical protein
MVDERALEKNGGTRMSDHDAGDAKLMDKQADHEDPLEGVEEITQDPDVEIENEVEDEGEDE